MVGSMVGHMDERVVLWSRIDGLLDALGAAVARAELAEEKLAYCEHRLVGCMEERGLIL